MPVTASVEEADSPFIACVTLTTEEGAMLAFDFVVELNTSGEIQPEIVFHSLRIFFPRHWFEHGPPGADK